MVHEYDTQNRQRYTPLFCLGVGVMAWFHGVALRHAWLGYNTVSSVEETAAMPFAHKSTSHQDQCLGLSS